jgi:hypothetical protein
MTVKQGIAGRRSKVGNKQQGLGRGIQIQKEQEVPSEKIGAAGCSEKRKTREREPLEWAMPAE